jgi:hypothetical protein
MVWGFDFNNISGCNCLGKPPIEGRTTLSAWAFTTASFRPTQRNQVFDFEGPSNFIDTKTAPAELAAPLFRFRLLCVVNFDLKPASLGFKQLLRKPATPATFFSVLTVVP